MDINLRNLMLAGIGSLAVSMEKGMEMINTLVEKGELTISQGKELNRELRNRFQGEKAAQTVDPQEFAELEARVSKLEEQQS